MCKKPFSTSKQRIEYRIIVLLAAHIKYLNCQLPVHNSGSQLSARTKQNPVYFLQFALFPKKLFSP